MNPNGELVASDLLRVKHICAFIHVHGALGDCAGLQITIKKTAVEQGG